MGKIYETEVYLIDLERIVAIQKSYGTGCPWTVYFASSDEGGLDIGWREGKGLVDAWKAYVEGRYEGIFET